nr:hypothetical protein [uncultured Cellulosilyticum sp.]
MRSSLLNKLSAGIGNKILVMTEAFPFFVVGTLQDADPSQIYVLSEFGVPAPLKNRVFTIQLDQISAFFVEEVPGQMPAIN